MDPSQQLLSGVSERGGSHTWVSVLPPKCHGMFSLAEAFTLQTVSRGFNFTRFKQTLDFVFLRKLHAAWRRAGCRAAVVRGVLERTGATGVDLLELRMFSAPFLQELLAFIHRRSNVLRRLSVGHGSLPAGCAVLLAGPYPALTSLECDAERLQELAAHPLPALADLHVRAGTSGNQTGPSGNHTGPSGNHTGPVVLRLGHLPALQRLALPSLTFPSAAAQCSPGSAVPADLWHVVGKHVQVEQLRTICDTLPRSVKLLHLNVLGLDRTPDPYPENWEPYREKHALLYNAANHMLQLRPHLELLVLGLVSPLLCPELLDLTARHRGRVLVGSPWNPTEGTLANSTMNRGPGGADAAPTSEEERAALQECVDHVLCRDLQRHFSPTLAATIPDPAMQTCAVRWPRPEQDPSELCRDHLNVVVDSTSGGFDHLPLPTQAAHSGTLLVAVRGQVAAGGVVVLPPGPWLPPNLFAPRAKQVQLRIVGVLGQWELRSLFARLEATLTDAPAGDTAPATGTGRQEAPQSPGNHVMALLTVNDSRRLDTLRVETGNLDGVGVSQLLAFIAPAVSVATTLALDMRRSSGVHAWGDFFREHGVAGHVRRVELLFGEGEPEEAEEVSELTREALLDIISCCPSLDSVECEALCWEEAVRECLQALGIVGSVTVEVPE